MTSRFDQLKEAPIFIIGPARSGTTWVYDIIKAHPQVAGVYESWLFTPNNGIGALFSTAHWPPNRSGLGNFLQREEVVKCSRDLIIKIISHAIQPNDQYLVEKSPNHIYAIPLIREIFPDAKFICVLRDGRDVAVSVRAAAKSWMKDWKNSFGHSLRLSTHAWKSAISRARQEARYLGDNYLEIRYEEIHSDPIPAYRQLFDFCRIPYDQGTLEEIFNTTDFSRNYKGGESKFRRGGRVGDWEQSFTIIDKYIFKRIAGDMLIELGYEYDNSW